MKVYISGPMTGLPDYNYPAFNACAEHLRALGHEPINPARPGEDGWDWVAFMRRALCDLSEADGIYMLPGWLNSRGACIEERIARDLDLERVDPEPACRCGHGFIPHMFGIASKDAMDYAGCQACECPAFEDDPLPFAPPTPTNHQEAAS